MTASSAQCRAPSDPSFTGPAFSAGPAGPYPFTGFQMMTFFVASSPGAGATLP